MHCSPSSKSTNRLTPYHSRLFPLAHSSQLTLPNLTSPLSLEMDYSIGTTPSHFAPTSLPFPTHTLEPILPRIRIPARFIPDHLMAISHPVPQIQIQIQTQIHPRQQTLLPQHSIFPPYSFPLARFRFTPCTPAHSAECNPTFPLYTIHSK